MARASTAWIRAGWALVLALAAVNVYRAATQSLTTDEAFMFNAFVDARVKEAVRFYDANHHVLYALAERATVAVFGVSELSVRLPAVVGGTLYLVAMLRICFYAFGPGWPALLCLALSTLSPFVMDYLSAARGYGLGLGLLMFAFDRMLRHAAEARPGVPYLAGIALALAVAANLVYLVPAVALACVMAVLLVRERGRAVLWELVDGFALPAVAVAFAILVVPFSRAAGSNYYYGAKTLAQSARGLAHPSLCPQVSGDLGRRFAEAVFPYLGFAPALALLLTVVAIAGAAAAFRGKRPGPRQVCAALAGGAIALTLAAFLAAHHALAVPYPFERTSIYAVPLLALAVVAATQRMRGARLAVGAAGALCVLQFVLVFRVDYYGSWFDDASVRRVVDQLRARESGARPVRVLVSWPSAPTVSFYKRRYGLNWLQPVARGPSGGTADYHVLWSSEAELVERLRLTVLFSDPLTGMLLAR